MDRFQDIEEFARQHRGCGSLIPRTSAPSKGGYLLTLACSCGQKLERWITDEEAREGAPTPPSGRSGESRQETAPRRPATSLPPRDSQSLEEVMKQALDSVDKPKAAGSSPPTADREKFDDILKAALDSVDKPASAPSTPSRPAAADRQKLDDAMKAALESLDTPQVAPRSAASPTTDRQKLDEPRQPAPRDGEKPTTAEAPRNLDDVMKAALESLETPARVKPDKQVLTDALKTTVEAFDAETRKAGRPAARVPTPVGEMISPAPEIEQRPRRFVFGAIVVVVAVLAAVAGFWFGKETPATSEVETPAPARPSPKARLNDADRTAAAGAMTVLKDLQSISRTDTTYRVYFNRVAFANSDASRSLDSLKDPDLRRTLQEVLSIHQLAAAAWRAKTLNERDKWETVGNDPAIELCPGTKRILGISDEPTNMPPVQWRGMVVAASIPLLWDCAAGRLAEADRTLKR